MDSRALEALRMKREMMRRFFYRGILWASLSGVAYGLFTAFLNLGMTGGVWRTWSATLSPFALTYLIGALGSALMYLFSAVWSVGIVAATGKGVDFFRTLSTRAGRNLMALALLSGPIAGTAYVIALQQAGSIVIPISGLCPAIGAILARLIYKQPMGGRALIGIGVCFAASVLIGWESLGAEAGRGMAIGVAMAFVAALIWGLEGAVGGYNSAMVDAQIGIAIRQCVAALSNLCVVLPFLSILSGEGASYAWKLLAVACVDGASCWAFALSGFFAMYAYSLWYKGNSMCGTALGMACNATYAFWGPLFCWVLLGLCFGEAGWDIPLIGWIAAVVMVVGIFIIAVDPREVLKGAK